MLDSSASANFAITVGSFNGDTGFDIFTLGSTGMTGYLATMNTGPIYGGYRGFTKNALFPLDPKSHLSTDYRTFQIRLYDADNDGLTDIVAIYGKQQGLKWMKQKANRRIDGPTNLLTSTVGAPDAFDIKDMNNDGIADIVIHSDIDDSIYLYLGKK